MKNEKVLLSILAIAISMIFLFSCAKKEQKTTEPYKVNVQIVEPVFRKYQEKLVFSGTSDTRKSTRVSFQVSGEIREMNFEVGQPVNKGDILARLDDKQYEANLGIALAQVSSAQASYNKYLVGFRAEDKAMAKAGMLQARANMEHAKSELERYENVYREDAVAKQQYDTVLNQYRVAREQYNSARSHYEMTSAGYTREDKAIALSNVQVAGSNLKSAEVQLSYTVLKAPLDGVISEKIAEIGALVGPGNPVYEIQSHSANDFVIYVPSIHMEKIHRGDVADVTFLNFPGRVIKAVVWEIQPVADQEAKSYRVKLKLKESPEMKGLSGIVGKATFYFKGKVRSATVPLSCIREKKDKSGYYVFAVREGRAEPVDVKVLRIEDEQVMISAVLPDKSQVVVSGQEYLNSGAPVNVVSALNAQDYVSPDKEPQPFIPQNNL